VLELPVDRPRPASRTFAGRHLAYTIDLDVITAARELATVERTTLFTVLLTAYLITLSRYSGQDDVVVGTPWAGRDRAELEDLIGFFVNMLVLRVDLSGDPTGAEAIRRVAAAVRETMAHHEVPFPKLVEALRPPRDPSRNPLFQVSFNLEVSDDTFSLPGLHVERIPAHTGTARWDLALFAAVHPTGLEIDLEYATELFDESTVRTMVTAFHSVLTQLIENTSRAVRDLDVPALGGATVQSGSAGPAPAASAGIEERLRGLWQETVGSAGGHSVLAEAVRRSFGVDDLPAGTPSFADVHAHVRRSLLRKALRGKAGRKSSEVENDDV
jgi:non-ribosomal peptide synthetase component F